MLRSCLSLFMLWYKCYWSENIKHFIK